MKNDQKWRMHWISGCLWTFSVIIWCVTLPAREMWMQCTVKKGNEKLFECKKSRICKIRSVNVKTKTNQETQGQAFHTHTYTLGTKNAATYAFVINPSCSQSRIFFVYTTLQCVHLYSAVLHDNIILSSFKIKSFQKKSHKTSRCQKKWDNWKRNYW